MDKHNESKQSSLSTNAMILTFSKVLNTLIALITAMLLARFRTLKEYGTYSQILTVVGLTISVVMLGLPNSLNLFIANANDNKERDSFLSIYFSLGTLLSILAGILLVVACPLICLYYKNNGIEAFTYVLAILPWTHVITTSISNMLVATNNTKRLLIYNLLRSLSLLLVIVFVRAINENFRFYMAFYVLVEIFFSLWVYYEARRLMDKIYFKPDLKLLKRILAFSIPMGIASAVGTLNVYLDQLMIGFYFDTETVAVYTNAAKELPFNLIATAFTAVLVPHMARQFREGKNKSAIQTWSDAIEFNTVILSFCSAACFVFAPQIMTILYSEKYLTGVGVFRVYALVLLIRITYFGMALNALGKSTYIFYSSIATLLINIILNYFMINAFDSVGAALATLISMALVALFQLLLTARMLKIPIRDIFPWKKVGKIILTNLIWAALAFVLLQIFNIGTTLNDIAIAIVIGSVFLIGYGLFYKKYMVNLYKKLGR